MREFLSSPYVSLACAGLNGVFALTALSNGSWFMFAVCAGFSGLCFRNYLRD